MTAKQRSIHTSRYRTPAPAPAPAPAPNIDSPIGESCSEVASRPSKPPASKAQFRYPAFPTIPGKRRKDTHWLLTPEQVNEWVETFTAVNVESECRQAHAWIMANLNRKKTASGMLEFLRKWLTKAQNSGGSKGTRPPTSRVPDAEDMAHWNPIDGGLRQ